MSKFLLRNLKNERRRIEKELKRIDKRIGRIENTEVIMEGSLELKSLINIDKTNLVFKNKSIDFGMKFNVKFEHFENEITCTLTTNDEKFYGVEKFVGKAICAVDEEFDLSTGMTLAQNRAIKEVYEYMIKLFT